MIEVWMRSYSGSHERMTRAGSFDLAPGAGPRLDFAGHPARNEEGTSGADDHGGLCPGVPAFAQGASSVRRVGSVVPGPGGSGIAVPLLRSGPARASQAGGL